MSGHELVAPAMTCTDMFWDGLFTFVAHNSQLGLGFSFLTQRGEAKVGQDETACELAQLT